MTYCSSTPVDDISAFVSKVGLLLEDFPARINRWWGEKQNAHRRAALREAYRRRRHWRKADIPKLRALGVCPAADRRLQRIESAKSPGRGVIRSYSPLDETLTTGIAHLSAFFDPATPPAKNSRCSRRRGRGGLTSSKLSIAASITQGRIAVLERLRENSESAALCRSSSTFDKPETKTTTETVRLLAQLSHLVIADVTSPRSVPLELQATVPEVMVPCQFIIEAGEEPFSMLEDLWIENRDRVFEPLYYSSLDALIGALDEKIIEPAKVRFAELLARKAEKMKGEHV